MSFDYSYNGTNLGDPRDTPEEKEIARLYKLLKQTRDQLVCVTAEREALKDRLNSKLIINEVIAEHPENTMSWVLKLPMKVGTKIWGVTYEQV